MACDMTVALLEDQIHRLNVKIENDERLLQKFKNRWSEQMVESKRSAINYNSHLIADIDIAIKILQEATL